MSARTKEKTTTTHGWVYTWAELAKERAGDDGADQAYWNGIANRLNHAGHMLDCDEPRRAASIIDGVIQDLLKAPVTEGARS